jgi:energy-coupling factor transporter ATP-binding protein EcfA2
MPEYDFSTLGSSDLENLVCDLLNEDLPKDSKVNYKTFKDGKDKGIDILYASEAHPYDHIGQVKHYYRTGFDVLLHHIKNTELAKVRLLTPNKYIFATSVDLSVKETERIQEVFKPFLKTVNDIYGKKDLNRLLATYEVVFNRHYKLWFSDAAVLKKILASELIYRTADFVENELTRRIRVHVRTPLLGEAKISLETNCFVVITGEPGVGKTTLAEMLVYDYLKEDFELLYIHDDIKEVEKFLRNDDSKQIVYFDDFLGSNAVEINKAQGSETALISIIRRIRRYPNKRLIFTTRTHILNIAIDQSEKLKRSHIKAAETIFNLHEYSRDLKTQLLLNHIDEAEIDPDLKSVLQEEQIFNFILEHQNFNPRSIEYITTKENIKEFNHEKYRSFIIHNFNNPQEIWAHAYRNQIGIGERLLLNTLLTFDGPVELPLLENAFNKRVQIDGKARQVLEINAFRTALYRLDKGFIVFQRNRVNFINPSLKDFLRQFLQNDSYEIGLILNSVRYIHQVVGSLLIMANEHKIRFSDELTADILSNFENYVRPAHRDHDLVRLAIFISTTFTRPKKKSVLVDIIYAINDWKQLYEDYQLSKDFFQFLNLNKNDQQIHAILQERTTEIVNDLILGERDVFKAVELLEQLKGIFNLDFINYDVSVIEQHLDNLFGEHISNEVDWLMDIATDESEIYDKKAKIIELQEKLMKLGFKYEVDMSEFKQDWFDIVMNNDFRRMMEKDD